MLKIAIASTSPQKIQGIVQAVSEFFEVSTSEIEVHSASVSSGVPEQPFNGETYKGAKNRLREILKKFPEMDIYVSCEAGIEGSNDGYREQYFNVHVVVIYSRAFSDIHWGKSTGWQIPSEDIGQIKLSSVDKYLLRKGIDTMTLTGKPRSDFVREATFMALSSQKLK